MNETWLVDLFQEFCLTSKLDISISCFASSGGMYTSLSIGKKVYPSDDEYFDEIISLFEATCGVVGYPENGISWLISPDRVCIELSKFVEDDEEFIEMTISKFSSNIYQLIK
jgi:hypothetical protein